MYDIITLTITILMSVMKSAYLLELNQGYFPLFYFNSEYQLT